MAATTSASAAAAAVSFHPPFHSARLAAAAPPSSAPPPPLRPPSPDLSIQLSPRPSLPAVPPPMSASFAWDRAEELQTEARAANATVFSPDLLSSRYGSRPFKVALRAAEVLSNPGAFGLKLLLDERTWQSSAMRRARAVELRTNLTRLDRGCPPGPTSAHRNSSRSSRSCRILSPCFQMKQHLHV